MGEFPILILNDVAGKVLEEPVSLEEVKRAIMRTHSFKASGPDEFQALFYKDFQDVLELDVRCNIPISSPTAIFGDLTVNDKSYYLLGTPTVDSPSLALVPPTSISSMVQRNVHENKPMFDGMLHPWAWENHQPEIKKNPQLIRMQLEIRMQIRIMNEESLKKKKARKKQRAERDALNLGKLPKEPSMSRLDHA
ncbi:hypothetical protein PIB30_045923 [Stylosanthes scabra]|uniref:Uncharacterized protein n=1 Tax=Stylosanthes scabra TaxID=79078 RepID=A0ABU6XE11_9FABA|nr:hypothetical protein [Stylosanthes scabra]